MLTLFVYKEMIGRVLQGKANFVNKFMNKKTNKWWKYIFE